MIISRILLSTLGCAALAGAVRAESPYAGNSEFAKYAEKLRENALTKVEPQVVTPTLSNTGPRSIYPWKRNIITTVFWVGETPTKNNPVPNTKSSWDGNWTRNFGGFDNPDPSRRRNYIPANFVPRQNPFYVALPYNDVTRGTTKPEAPRVIPWFKREFQRYGASVCKGRWLAIRKGNRVAYAQWEDCGPFRTDHWQYVFGNARPLPNLNGGAGLDVSPAVRDFLGLKGTDYCDWKFVEARDVPSGPWRLYGDNNPFAQKKKIFGKVVDNRSPGKMSTRD